MQRVISLQEAIEWKTDMSGRCGRMDRWSVADSSGLSRRVARGTALLAGVVAICGVGCRSGLPKPSSPTYREYVSTFYVGLAALQVGDDVRAEKELGHATELVAGEPAGWANWGILRLRQRDFDAASERLERAKKLAPQNGHIYYLLGLVEIGKGHSAEGSRILRNRSSLILRT